MKSRTGDLLVCEGGAKSGRCSIVPASGVGNACMTTMTSRVRASNFVARMNMCEYVMSSISDLSSAALYSIND